MISYLEYNDNEEDDRCLRNIFGRNSSSSSSSSPSPSPSPSLKEKNEEKEEIGEMIPEEDTPQITSYRLHHINQDITIETNKKHGIAYQLWPASYLLCNYLQTNLQNIISTPLEQTDILELGAGVGLCGIFLSILGCYNVIITDLPEAIPLINMNIQHNRHLYHPNRPLPSSNILRWGIEEDFLPLPNHHNNDNHHQLYLIAADCVYWEHLYLPFYQTIFYYINTHNAILILSHYKRWKKEKKFFNMCMKVFHIDIIYENIELVPHLDEHIHQSYSRSGNTNHQNDHNNEMILDHKIPLRKQISRIYKMSKKII